MKIRVFCFFLIVVAVCSVCSSLSVMAHGSSLLAPQIISPIHHDVSPALRTLSPVPPSKNQRVHPHAMPAPIKNFDGLNNLDRGIPPDTNGDVGPNNYVQWVNSSFAVYHKDGTLLYGPAGGNTLWQGFGGPCESRNDGDPIALYDPLADRWLMSQPAWPDNGPPYYQCLAVSTSPDPTGSYYRYAFTFNDFNDYPKFGVWPDG